MPEHPFCDFCSVDPRRPGYPAVVKMRCRDGRWMCVFCLTEAATRILDVPNRWFYENHDLAHGGES